jgi:hypothetical protein
MFRINRKYKDLFKNKKWFNITFLCVIIINVRMILCLII